MEYSPSPQFPQYISVSIISALQKQAMAFKACHSELKLKTSLISGPGSVFCSLYSDLVRLWERGLQRLKFPSGSESVRDKFTSQNKEGVWGAVCPESRGGRNLVCEAVTADAMTGSLD